MIKELRLLLFKQKNSTQKILAEFFYCSEKFSHKKTVADEIVCRRFNFFRLFFIDDFCLVVETFGGNVFIQNQQAD